MRLYTGAGSRTFPVDPWMVERIDVIRGPASVLYGEGATSAVINVIAKKPFEDEIHNRLRLGYGSHDREQLGLDSGGSLTDTLSYRLTLKQQQSNGWVDQGQSRSLALSAALRWQATDDLSFSLAHERGESEPASYFGTPLIAGKYRDSLRDKNYNLRNTVQRYNDEWTRLNTDAALNDNVSASNQLYYIKSRRHWRNAEAYNWISSREQLLRGDYLEIKHGQEQIGDRQSFTFNHSLFGLDSRTVFGLKQQFWNNRGEWTLAAYHIVKKKLLTTDPLIRLAQQIGQQSSDGLETSLELALDHGWQVSANASVVRAEYDDFDEMVSGTPAFRAGIRPTNVPRRTANLWLNKTLTPSLEAGMGLRYVNARYANTANTVDAPGYTVRDANLGWQALPDVCLGLQLNNLLDRRHAAAQQNSGQQWMMGEPRSLFVTANYSF